MIQQTIVVTPPVEQTAQEVMSYIASLLPEEVLNFMRESSVAGTRDTNISKDGNVVTVVNMWDEAAAAEYKTLMTNVSDNVITEMNNNGWDIVFTPLTKDL